MTANPSPTDPLQAPVEGPDAKVQAALAFIVRAEGGLLPELPLGVYPNLRFRFTDGRLVVHPRPADTIIRRDYRAFVHEHLPELKEICRLRQEAVASQRSGPESLADSTPADHTSGPASAEAQDSDVESRVAPGSRSDWRKTSVSESDRVSLPNYGASTGIPADPTPAPPAPLTKEPDPELYVDGYRITEHDVLAMLSSFGDEALAEYEHGKLPKAVAYQQAKHFYTRSVRMGIQVVIRGSSGRIFIHPQLQILRPPSTRQQP